MLVTFDIAKVQKIRVSEKEINDFICLNGKIFVPLTAPKVLSLDNKRKKTLFLCIVLFYPYLCSHEDKNTTYHIVPDDRNTPIY